MFKTIRALTAATSLLLLSLIAAPSWAQEILSREVSYWMDVKSILIPEQNQKSWNLFEQDSLGQDETTRQ